MENTIAWVRSVLSTTPTRWMNLSALLPLELLNRKPAPAEWSAMECLQHMIDTERLFHSRLQAFLSGQNFLPAFNPDEQGTPVDANLSPSDIVAEFARLRAHGLAALNAVQLADLSRQSRHQELGVVTLGEMLNEWAGHDLNHTIQAERALMQPFIQGCGAWQIYFSDHVINA